MSVRDKIRRSYGIECWLANNGFVFGEAKITRVSARFLKSKGMPYQTYRKTKSSYSFSIDNLSDISEAGLFKEFTEYVKENYKQK